MSVMCSRCFSDAKPLQLCRACRIIPYLRYPVFSYKAALVNAIRTVIAMFSGLLKCMRANIAAFMIADDQKLINRREIPKNAPRNKISSRTGAKTSTSSTRTTGTSVNAGTDARLDCLMECVVEHLTWETYDERIRSRN